MDAPEQQARGVAIHEFPLKPGHGFAVDLLHEDGKAAGLIDWPTGWQQLPPVRPGARAARIP
ncbi:hypothetical protein [Thiomonas sp.]|jgi:hypothetical protein|uniref:hypothetical protein n=1 Tax=Thiomonas sp. TaxID=2047785 RepID=UPI0025911D65|nr:hypothetical protein [Thiomonas sp.]